MLDRSPASPPSALFPELAEALRAARRPIETARGLPAALYADPATAQAADRRLLHEGWACIGFGADVPSPGDAVPVDHFGAPLLLLRDRGGALRVFENVCRHRGMILVAEPRNFGGVIRCPYHSWCYSLDGKLRATPHVGGPGINAHPAVDPAETGLNELRSGVFLDCVFVTMSPEAPDFADWIAPLAARWSDFSGQTLHAGGAESVFGLEVAANWKLAVENYCESYHLPWVHPGLNSYSRLEDHYPIAETGFSGQGTSVYAPQMGDDAFPDFPGLSAPWAKGAEYASLFPNLLLGVHRDHVFAMRLAPQGHDRTREHVRIWYASDEAARSDRFAARRARSAELWAEVFAEDVFVVEGMQKGRSAPGFDGGRFSPVMDGPTHAFHAWAAERLGA